MTALDFALPIEYRPMGRGAPDSRLALYAGPRLIRESFVDRDTFGSSTRGLLFGGFMGAVGRWRFVTVSGEVNVARTPTLELGDEVFRGGWIGLPSLRVTAVLPF
jgi:hypothetical protein